MTSSFPSVRVMRSAAAAYQRRSDGSLDLWLGKLIALMLGSLNSRDGVLALFGDEHAAEPDSGIALGSTNVFSPWW